MAEVFKAKSYTESGFEKIVALKRLLPSYSEDQAFVQMFLQEARIAARLRHESICPLYELGQVEGDYYLTMEFIYGHDLRATLKALKRKRETMDPWICAFIALRVAQALEYAWTALDDDGEPLHLRRHHLRGSHARPGDELEQLLEPTLRAARQWRVVHGDRPAVW